MKPADRLKASAEIDRNTFKAIDAPAEAKDLVLACLDEHRVALVVAYDEVCSRPTDDHNRDVFERTESIYGGCVESSLAAESQAR